MVFEHLQEFTNGGKSCGIAYDWARSVVKVATSLVYAYIMEFGVKRLGRDQLQTGAACFLA